MHQIRKSSFYPPYVWKRRHMQRVFAQRFGAATDQDPAPARKTAIFKVFDYCIPFFVGTIGWCIAYSPTVGGLLGRDQQVSMTARSSSAFWCALFHSLIFQDIHPTCRLQYQYVTLSMLKRLLIMTPVSDAGNARCTVRLCV